MLLYHDLIKPFSPHHSFIKSKHRVVMHIFHIQYNIHTQIILNQLSYKLFVYPIFIFISNTNCDIIILCCGICALIKNKSDTLFFYFLFLYTFADGFIVTFAILFACVLASFPGTLLLLCREKIHESLFEGGVFVCLVSTTWYYPLQILRNDDVLFPEINEICADYYIFTAHVSLVIGAIVKWIWFQFQIRCVYRI
jgi:hypothetical protein